MVKIALRPLTEKEFAEILKNDLNLLEGGSLEDIDIFRLSRPPIQGSGFFDVLSSIGKFVLPAFKKYIAPVASEFAHGFIDDVASGKNLKMSIKDRGKQGLSKIGSRILRGKGSKSKKSKKSVKRLKTSHKRRPIHKKKSHSSKRKNKKYRNSKKKKSKRSHPLKNPFNFPQKKKQKFHDIFS